MRGGGKNSFDTKHYNAVTLYQKNDPSLPCDKVPIDFGVTIYLGGERAFEQTMTELCPECRIKWLKRITAQLEKEYNQNKKGIQSK